MIEPLINRLRIEDIQTIQEYGSKYPTSAKYLLDSLSECGNWLSLEYDVILLINDIFGCGYSPSAIGKLFPTK